jgi:hypothetical protein
MRALASAELTCENDGIELGGNWFGWGMVIALLSRNCSGLRASRVPESFLCLFLRFD